MSLRCIPHEVSRDNRVGSADARCAQAFYERSPERLAAATVCTYGPPSGCAMSSTDDKARGQMLVGCLPALFAYVCRLVGDREIASDIVQEVSLRALAGGGPRDEKDFLPWSYGIARHVIGSEWRRRRRGRVDEAFDAEGLDQFYDPKASPDQIADARASLARALSDDGESLTLLFRRYVGNVSGKALAHELGMTPTALRMRLMRLRASARARQGDT
jgi:RNA polymerase sigma factor (sigma-70 family)